MRQLPSFVPRQSLALIAFAALACDSQQGVTATIRPADQTLSILSGQGQSVAINSPLATSLTIKAIDPTGAPVTGVTVTWQVTSGTGSVTPTTSVTTTDGIASANYTSAAVTGPVVVTASASGFAPAVFAVTVTASGASVASSLSIVSGDGQTVRKLAAVPAPLTAEVLDQFGAGMPGAQVTWVIEAGGGALSANSTTTDATGMTSTVYTAGPTVGTSAISATVAGVAPVRFTVTVSGG